VTGKQHIKEVMMKKQTIATIQTASQTGVNPVEVAKSKARQAKSKKAPKKKSRRQLIEELEGHIGIEILATLGWVELKVGSTVFIIDNPLEPLAQVLSLKVSDLKQSLDLRDSRLTVVDWLRYYCFLHLAIRVVALEGSWQQTGVWFSQLHPDLKMTPLEALRRAPYALECYLEDLEVQSMEAG
jgi:hypothetical protein